MKILFLALVGARGLLSTAQSWIEPRMPYVHDPAREAEVQQLVTAVNDLAAALRAAFEILYPYIPPPSLSAIEPILLVITTILEF